MNSFLLLASIINDLLPYRPARPGKSAKEITSTLRREGYDVTERVVKNTLENMVPVFGLEKTIHSRGLIRWKRVRPNMVGHCIRAHDFQDDPLDFEGEDPCTGMDEHAMHELNSGF